MGKFVRSKKQGENEYFYEVTTRYDPETKNSRQKVKYLGKNIDGQPVRTRTSLPRSAYTFGDLVLPLHVEKELGITKKLEGLLTTEECNSLHVFVLNRVLRPMSSMMIGSWYEGSYLYKLHPGLKMTGQQISNFFARIGESNIPDIFTGSMIEDLGTDSVLVYDLTRLASYSKTLELLEYGHNREGDGLRQVNLSMIVDKKRGVPVMYDLYPGSIVDVSTLVNTLRRISTSGIGHYTLILDRGFFSASNLDELVANDVSFIIPASQTMKQVKEMVYRTRDIKHPMYLHKFKDFPMYVKPITLKVAGKTFQGYLYHSQKKEDMEKNGFLCKLNDVREKLVDKEIPGYRNPGEVFKETAGAYSPYFSWKREANHFTVNIRKNAVSRRLNKMGRFVLVYNGIAPGWEECLSMYREKDIVEKSFKTIKHDIELKPLNVRRESTLRGLVFACFLALVIRMRIIRLMKEKKLLEKYTPESLFLELEKIKKIELENGDYMITELTKKQKDILDALDLRSCVQNPGV